MFSSVNLLIVLDDFIIARTIQRASEAMGFETRVIITISSFLNEKADILILGTHLPNGEADLVLDRWIAQRHGPVCLICDKEAPVEYENDLIARGAWNVLRRPLRLETIQSALHRYGSAVMQGAKLDILEAKIKRTEIMVIVLAILVAAFGGVEVVPWLLKILGL